MISKTANGAWSSAPSSNATESYRVSPWRLALYAAGLGALGVVLHALVRVPLHLPGHHGLEWMALLAFGRMGIGRRWFASGVGTAAAGLSYLPLWGLHSLLAPLGYLVSAVLFDVICNVAPARAPRLMVLAVSAGLAFAAVGAITFYAGVHVWSGHPGLVVWLWAHAAFGLVGAVIGAQAGAWAVRRLSRPR